MLEEKIFTSDYKLENIEEKDGKFFFTATSLDNNFECEKGRAILSKKSVGKPYIWRHQHPIQEGNEDTHIYGEVVESHINDKGFIESTYEVYSHTEDHLKIREIIKERQKIGEPLGVSMRYRKYFIGDKILHYDVFEHSGTPYPKCETCKTIEFKGEKNNMPNEEEKLEDEVEPDLDEAYNKIKELEEQVNSKTKIYEELKSKVETLEKEVKEKDKILEETEKTEKSLEEKLKDMQNEIEYLKKKPVIDKIKKIKKMDDRMLEFFKSQDKDYLEEKYKEYKNEAESQIHVKSMEESAEEAQKKSEEELQKKAPAMKKFVQNVEHKFKKTKFE